MTRKPTVPEVLPLVRAIYARHPAGCCWHIVLDDGNIDDDSVRWCVENLLRHECLDDPDGGECLLLGLYMPLLSKTQRRKLVASK
jgi:hypothetical protein